MKIICFYSSMLKFRSLFFIQMVSFNLALYFLFLMEQANAQCHLVKRFERIVPPLWG